MLAKRMNHDRSPARGYGLVPEVKVQDTPIQWLRNADPGVAVRIGLIAVVLH
jgi:hypothetical protein